MKRGFISHRSGFYLEDSKGERHQGDLEPIAIVKYVPYFPKDIVHLVEESLGSTPMKLENRKGARSGNFSQNNHFISLITPDVGCIIEQGSNLRLSGFGYFRLFQPVPLEHYLSCII